MFDQELTYDFNFQDIRSIGPRKVMPVSENPYTAQHIELVKTSSMLPPREFGQIREVAGIGRSIPSCVQPLGLVQ